MTPSMQVAAAIVFTWAGLVVGISFIEAPVKFRAPGVTTQIGLGIGRLVFRVVNVVEAAFALAVVITLLAGSAETFAGVALGIAVATLAAQLLFVRPRLARRSDMVLAGGDAPRSHAHHAYIVLEIIKLAALVTGGIAVLSS